MAPINVFKPGDLLQRILQSAGVDQAAAAMGQGSDIATGYDDPGTVTLEDLLAGTDQQDTLGDTLSLLNLMRSYRNDAGGGGTPSIAGLLDRLAAPGQEYNMGFNPGGLADILMGIVSGAGTAEAMNRNLIPDDVRRANIIPVEALMGSSGQAAPQGNLFEDIATARDLARFIMQGPQAETSSTTGAASAPRAKITPPGEPNMAQPPAALNRIINLFGLR